MNSTTRTGTPPSYEDYRQRVTCTHVLEFGLGPRYTRKFHNLLQYDTMHMRDTSRRQMFVRLSHACACMQTAEEKAMIMRKPLSHSDRPHSDIHSVSF